MISENGVGIQKETTLQPQILLKNAIKAVPAVKYALGISGIVAVVALVGGFRIDYRVQVLGGLAVFLGMVVLVVFANAAGMPGSKMRLQAIVLTWFALSMLILSTFFLFSCVFFEWPQSLAHWIKPNATFDKSSKEQDFKVLMAKIEDSFVTIYLDWNEIKVDREKVLIEISQIKKKIVEFSIERKGINSTDKLELKNQEINYKIKSIRYSADRKVQLINALVKVIDTVKPEAPEEQLSKLEEIGRSLQAEKIILEFQLLAAEQLEERIIKMKELEISTYKIDA